MPATAENLRDLHQLHQRARALRDRLSSGPKTLAARQAALAARQAELEAARKALQDAKMHVKKHEHTLKGVETKIDDLKIKLNQVKKNDEYKALQNQIAHDNAAKGKAEEDILSALEDDRDQDRRGRQARGRRQAIRRRGRGPPAADRRADRRPQGPAPRARDGDHRRPRSPSPRTIATNTAGSSPATAPTPWPPARMAPASAAITVITAQMMNDLINGGSASPSASVAAGCSTSRNPRSPGRSARRSDARPGCRRPNGCTRSPEGVA